MNTQQVEFAEAKAKSEAAFALAANNTYRIIDSHTGKVVATGLSFRGALRSCDKRDNAYGSYRFVRQVEAK